tara:strand:+ start:1758 stop:2618 length:861 start_codon:yes stop_codon:yes gene_type:complete
MSNNKKIDNIFVIGLGLIGASLCRSLKESNQFKKIYGYDVNNEVSKIAIEKRYIDASVEKILDGIEKSDLIVFCVPVSEITACLYQSNSFFNSEKIFTDTLSAKEKIIKYFLENDLSDINNFIYSHPMAGTENYGIKNSKKDLFTGSTSIICSMKNSSNEALDVVKKLWEFVGCKTSEIEIDYHDEILAAVSHIPHFISFSLSKKIVDLDFEDKYSWVYEKGSLADMLRISKSDPVAWANIFLSNKKYISKFINEYIEDLKLLDSNINSENIDNLISLLKKSNSNN